MTPPLFPHNKPESEMHSHKTPRRPIECVTLELYMRSKWVHAGNVFFARDEFHILVNKTRSEIPSFGKQSLSGSPHRWRCEMGFVRGGSGWSHA